MTLNICCKENDDCIQETDCIPARILSKEATEEILGEKLSSLIAIGKDGKPVLFIPNTKASSKQCEDLLDEEESTTLLNITIRIPKHQARARKFCVCYPPGGEAPYGCWR
jgi:hypothetical protein